MRKEVITAKSNSAVVGTKDHVMPENFDELVHKYSEQTNEQKFTTWHKARVVELQNSMRTPPKMDERTKKIVAASKKIVEGSIQDRVVQFILDNPGVTESEIIKKMKEMERELMGTKVKVVDQK